MAMKEDLMGGDIARNAEILREVLGGAKGPKRDIVALNAGAALYVAGLAKNLKEGSQLAVKALESGAAKKTLADWIAFTRK
jgi:anthranilate phosphoribosyltransferase